MAEPSSTSQTLETTSVKNVKINTETMTESQNKDNFRQCNICFEDTKPDMLVNTPCGHIFCCDCFFEWMKQNYTCPCCRTLLIKREETQLETLRVNRAEIAVQEEHIGDIQEDVRNLRRLQRIHKRRIKQLESSNETQMKRQIRLRLMLSQTRDVRDNIIDQIQDIIPKNKLQRFTTSFYRKLVTGDCENALKEAKSLIKRAALHEWKQRNSKVMDELCAKCKTGRCDTYLDRCLDELLENTNERNGKRSSNDIYTSTESETSGTEEEKTSEGGSTNQQSAARGRARRRMRVPGREERVARQSLSQYLDRNIQQEPLHTPNGTTGPVGRESPGIVIPYDASGNILSNLMTIINNYTADNDALDEVDAISTPETVESDATSTPETVETVESDANEMEQEQSIVPVPNFTFTMPDSGEVIEFSWNPPEHNEEVFVFGASENRDDNSNE